MYMYLRQTGSVTTSFNARALERPKLLPPESAAAEEKTWGLTVYVLCVGPGRGISKAYSDRMLVIRVFIGP